MENSLRAPEPFDNLAETHSFALGIDLGGTKTEAIALTSEGIVLDRWRVPSPVGNYEATVRMIADLAAFAAQRFGERFSVGVGMPGAISPATGLVKNANSTWLIGHAFGRDLGEALNRPVALANDADCFALSEARDGAGEGAASVWGIILGTGVGSGIVVGGKLLGGPNAIAGEWGHNPLPWPTDAERDGPACYCGRKGCIETFLSGPGFAADHLRRTGESLSPAAIVAAAAAGDVGAAASLARHAERLARATAAVINILDPEVIVLGGGLSNLECLYARVPEIWPRFVFSDAVATRLAPPRHGDSSGVRGAAWLGRLAAR
jgi:fructokinase